MESCLALYQDLLHPGQLSMNPPTIERHPSAALHYMLSPAACGDSHVYIRSSTILPLFHSPVAGMVSKFYRDYNLLRWRCSISKPPRSASHTVCSLCSCIDCQVSETFASAVGVLLEISGHVSVSWQRPIVSSIFPCFLFHKSAVSCTIPLAACL